MKRCCWCCISLQKGVVAIGVLSMVVSLVLCCGYGAVGVTLEERLEACRNGTVRDVLALLPSCQALQEAHTLLTARIFVYVQCGVWMLYFIFSVLLVVAAVKERTGLVVPWLVLSVVVVAAVVWAGVKAALHHHTLDLLASVLAVGLVTYCCLVVRSFVRQVKKDGLVPVPVQSTFHLHHPRTCPSRRCCDDDTRPDEGANGDDDRCSPSRLQLPRVLPRELPPAYTPTPPVPVKKGPPPTGLGIRI